MEGMRLRLLRGSEAQRCSTWTLNGAPCSRTCGLKGVSVARVFRTVNELKTVCTRTVAFTIDDCSNEIHTIVCADVPKPSHCPTFHQRSTLVRAAFFLSCRVDSEVAPRGRCDQHDNLR